MVDFFKKVHAKRKERNPHFLSSHTIDSSSENTGSINTSIDKPNYCRVLSYGRRPGSEVRHLRYGSEEKVLISS